MYSAVPRMNIPVAVMALLTSLRLQEAGDPEVQ